MDDGGRAVSEAWSTEEPLTVDRLIAELLTRGAHQTDIGDALELVTLIGCRNSVGEDQSVVVRGAP